ncbi:hypothetical protein L1987_28366 [Smallanthus sonchifolius]|uniref:Uncharacterized protein n=1 Tax=Smallanthus sonchifolius TaxID=185202 RepID=A0ACB9HWW6_9ASTR|nr:hypothetical protein L1987_28366 [Smallanthus sonchifolius]
MGEFMQKQRRRRRIMKGETRACKGMYEGLFVGFDVMILGVGEFDTFVRVVRTRDVSERNLKCPDTRSQANQILVTALFSSVLATKRFPVWLTPQVLSCWNSQRRITVDSYMLSIVLVILNAVLNFTQKHLG